MTDTKDLTIQYLLETVNAIKARIDGEWDNPALKAYGDWSTDTKEDIKYMAIDAIEHARQNGFEYKP